MFSLILHGRRSVEMQKWRNLRVSAKLLQNAFAFSSSSANAGDVSTRGNTFTVSYLVESLGLTRKLAESISKKISFEDKLNPDSVLNLLRSHEKFEETLKKVIDMGFDPTKSQFVEALHVVYEMSDKTIEEKVNVYKRLGFSEEDVWKIFKKWPFFLKFSEKKIMKTFETLKNCGLTEEEVLSVLKSRPQCIRDSEKKILDSIETFAGLGFSRDDSKMMIKRFPQCLGYSAESMEKKFEFLHVKLVPELMAIFTEHRIS
ncbi:unnamed protein product [Thlaspi arvense]|uniref:Mitochondrial transcription termination factor family protein n=1 Tax=Thlaspi arvense TaxID=13288 RepID=A0AAU9SFA1_THLAR|nr:unnamed protein product [Thlaspi arvense]